MTRLERLENECAVHDEMGYEADEFGADLRWALAMLREAEEIIEFAEDNDIHAAEMAGQWLAKLREEA